MKMSDKIAVILPCYNEEREISDIVEKVNSFSLKNKEFEFIFVDDGSTDQTFQLLNIKLNELNNKGLKAIGYKNNKGKGFAIKHGILNSSSNIVCFTDSDLAYSLEHLFLIKKTLQNADMAVGSRKFHKDNAKNTKLIRIIFGLSFNLFIRFILGLKFKDTQAGVKGFKRPLANEIFPLQKIPGWAFDVESIFLAQIKGANIKEFPAKVSEDHIKVDSKINLIRDSFSMFYSLLKIKLNHITGKYG